MLSCWEKIAIIFTSKQWWTLLSQIYSVGAFLSSPENLFWRISLCFHHRTGLLARMFWVTVHHQKQKTSQLIIRANPTTTQRGGCCLIAEKLKWLTPACHLCVLHISVECDKLSEDKRATCFMCSVCRWSLAMQKVPILKISLACEYSWVRHVFKHFFEVTGSLLHAFADCDWLRSMRKHAFHYLQCWSYFFFLCSNPILKSLCVCIRKLTHSQEQWHNVKNSQVVKKMLMKLH